jgi:hypothetical protein
MRRFIIFSVFFVSMIAGGAFAQSSAHPTNFYPVMGKTIKWADRFIRQEFDQKPDKRGVGQDTVMLTYYNPESDLQVALYFVDDVCEYVGFNDYSLDANGVNTFFTQWCIDVTEHYRLVSEKDEKYPMFEDTSFNIVFYIPEQQPLDRGMQYFMFSGFVRNEMALSGADNR